MHLWFILSGVLLVALIAVLLVRAGGALIQNLNDHPGLS
jgi:hypothetical protein